MFNSTKNNYFQLVNKKQSKKQTSKITKISNTNNGESPSKDSKKELEDKIKEVQDLRQLEQDLQDLAHKIADVQAQIDLIKDEYKYKKDRYHDSKMKMEESRHYKERVKNQMKGFLIMYEVKREETLKELSKKLQNSEKYKQERVF